MVAGSPHYHTIDGLFHVIHDAINNEADQLSVSYDGELGYPTNVEIDYMSNSIDAEYIGCQRLLASLSGYFGMAAPHHTDGTIGTLHP